MLREFTAVGVLQVTTTSTCPEKLNVNLKVSRKLITLGLSLFTAIKGAMLTASTLYRSIRTFGVTQGRTFPTGTLPDELKQKIMPSWGARLPQPSAAPALTGGLLVQHLELQGPFEPRQPLTSVAGGYQ